MYIRTPRAYCWRDDIAAPQRPTSPTFPPSHRADAPAPTLWALRPWPTQAGSLVGVRLVLGEVQAALRSGTGLRWVAADKVLTQREAQRWAANGFHH